MHKCQSQNDYLGHVLVAVITEEETTNITEKERTVTVFLGLSTLFSLIFIPKIHSQNFENYIKNVFTVCLHLSYYLVLLCICQSRECIFIYEYLYIHLHVSPDEHTLVGLAHFSELHGKALKLLNDVSGRGHAVLSLCCTPSSICALQHTVINSTHWNISTQ